MPGNFKKISCRKAILTFFILLVCFSTTSLSEVELKKEIIKGGVGYVAEGNVDVPADKVWKIATDFARYPDFQDNYYFTRIISESAQSSTVSFQMDDGTGGSIDFILFFKKDFKKKRIEFTSKKVNRGIEKIEGEILIEALNENQTKVVYKIYVSGGRGILRVRSSFGNVATEFVEGIPGQAYLYDNVAPVPIEASRAPNTAGCNIPDITLPPYKGKKVYLAVLEFVVSGQSLSKQIAKPLTDSFMSSLLKTGHVELLNRENMKEILAEFELQQAGYCDEQACAVEIGRLLGVEKIVTGSVSQVGNFYFVSIQMVNLETGSIEKIADARCSGSMEDLFYILDYLAKKLFVKS